MLPGAMKKFTGAIIVDVPSLMRVERQYNYAMHLARSAPQTMHFLSRFSMEGWSGPKCEEDILHHHIGIIVKVDGPSTPGRSSLQ